MSKINHYCVICGVGYHACESCNELKNINLWQRFTDTSNHYRIFLILRDHHNKIINDKQAYEMLMKCDIRGHEKFNNNVSEHIKKIIRLNTELVNVKKITNKKNRYKVSEKNK